MLVTTLQAFGGGYIRALFRWYRSAIPLLSFTLPEQPSSKVSMPDQVFRHVLRGTKSVMMWVRHLTGGRSGGGQPCEES